MSCLLFMHMYSECPWNHLRDKCTDVAYMIEIPAVIHNLWNVSWIFQDVEQIK